MLLTTILKIYIHTVAQSVFFRDNLEKKYEKIKKVLSYMGMKLQEM